MRQGRSSYSASVKRHHPLVLAGLAGIGFAKLAYLFGEGFFNAVLVEVTRQAGLTQSLLDNIELMGRSLASFGIALLLIGLTLRWLAQRWKPTAPAALVSLVLAGALASSGYAGSYHLQGAALAWAERQVSDEQAYNLYHLVGAQRLVVNGVLEIPDLGIESDGVSRADAAALAMFPVGYRHRNDVVAQLREDSDPWIQVFMRQRAFITRFEDDYSAYQEAQQELGRAWVQYQQAANETVRETHAEAERVQKQVQSGVLKLENAWGKYKHLSDRYRTNVLDPRLREGNIRQLRDTIAKGSTGANFRFYQQFMRAYFDGRIPEIDYWCGTRNGCSLSLGQVRSKVRTYLNRAFIRRSGGLPPGLTRSQFYRHEALDRRLANAVNGYVNGDIASLGRAWARGVDEATEKARTRFQARSAGMLGGDGVPLGLGLDDFLAAAAAEHPQMADDLTGPQWRLDRAGYFKHVWAPRVGAELAGASQDYLPESVATFAQQEWQSRRQAAIRSAIVLPFAMVMSLSVFLLNLASLSASLFGRRWVKHAVSAALVVIGALIATPYWMQGRDNGWGVAVSTVYAGQRIVAPLTQIVTDVAPEALKTRFVPSGLPPAVQGVR